MHAEQHVPLMTASVACLSQRIKAQQQSLQVPGQIQRLLLLHHNQPIHRASQTIADRAIRIAAGMQG